MKCFLVDPCCVQPTARMLYVVNEVSCIVTESSLRFPVAPWLIGLLINPSPPTSAGETSGASVTIREGPLNPQEAPAHTRLRKAQSVCLVQKGIGPRVARQRRYPLGEKADVT